MFHQGIDLAVPIRLVCLAITEIRWRVEIRATTPTAGFWQNRGRDKRFERDVFAGFLTRWNCIPTCWSGSRIRAPHR